MPWYKFYADHGPGHQSHSEDYRYHAEPLRKADRADEWEEWIYGFRHIQSHAIGDIKLVRKLPEKIRKAKLEAAKSNLKHWQKMVMVLEG
jgi:hypothetical protein